MDYDRRHFSYLARYNRSANEAMIAHLASSRRARPPFPAAPSSARSKASSTTS